MSVSKLLSRIIAPDSVLSAEDGDEDEVIKQLHEHTYGITSDPMTQFAAVVAALIHDVDHTGVPNAQVCWVKSYRSLFATFVEYILSFLLVVLHSLSRKAPVWLNFIKTRVWQSKIRLSSLGIS